MIRSLTSTLLAICVLMLFPTASVADDASLERRLDRCVAAVGVPDHWTWFLMCAESGGKKVAKNASGAMSYWQMMPATARRFGCVGDGSDDYDAQTKCARAYITSIEQRYPMWNRDMVIMAWALGAHNLLRMSAVPKKAKDLAWTVNRLEKLWQRRHQ